jgi:hypothetical protein
MNEWDNYRSVPNQYIDGYERALDDWEQRPDEQFAPVNPFPEGTEAHEGYEEAVSDLTRK